MYLLLQGCRTEIVERSTPLCAAGLCFEPRNILTTHFCNNHGWFPTRCTNFFYLFTYRVFNLKVDRILIWVIYLLRFTKCYITQLTCIYSNCWKLCPFISVHLSTRFTMFLANFLSVLQFTSSMARVIYWRLPSKFFKETLSTVGVRHRF